MARRSGLGRGLGALIPNEVVGDEGSTLLEVPVASIRPNALQPRTHFDEEAMASLAASIREVGVLQPVLVRPVEGQDGSYELIAGERRWRAARRAGLQSVPALVESEASDVHSLEQALVENLHREDLNALEEAAAYQQLIDEFGFTHEKVATRVGKSRTVVTNTLRLLQLPAGAQRALAEGSISAGHARALLATPDRSFQESLVRRIVSEGLTVRAVEDVVRAERADDEGGSTGGTTSRPPGSDSGTTSSVPSEAASEASSPASDRASSAPRTDLPGRNLPEPGVLELEELLAEYLNTRVKVELRNRRGRVMIEFATLEDLERIYRAMVEGDRSISAQTLASPM